MMCIKNDMYQRTTCIKNNVKLRTSPAGCMAGWINPWKVMIIHVKDRVFAHVARVRPQKQSTATMKVTHRDREGCFRRNDEGF